MILMLLWTSFSSPTSVNGMLSSSMAPVNRETEVSFALRAYASLATSADKGAVRDKSKLGG